MRNDKVIYLKYILHNIKYLDLDIRLPEPIISHLDINILLHNWYYQLLRHGYFSNLQAYHLLQLHKWYYHLLRHSLKYKIGIINNLGPYFSMTSS
jgi:hypothetical protein